MMGRRGGLLHTMTMSISQRRISVAQQKLSRKQQKLLQVWLKMSIIIIKTTGNSFKINKKIIRVGLTIYIYIGKTKNNQLNLEEIVWQPRQTTLGIPRHDHGLQMKLICKIMLVSVLRRSSEIKAMSTIKWMQEKRKWRQEVAALVYPHSCKQVHVFAEKV